MGRQAGFVGQRFSRPALPPSSCIYSCRHPSPGAHARAPTEAQRLSYPEVQARRLAAAGLHPACRAGARGGGGGMRASSGHVAHQAGQGELAGSLGELLHAPGARCGVAALPAPPPAWLARSPAALAKASSKACRSLGSTKVVGVMLKRCAEALLASSDWYLRGQRRRAGGDVKAAAAAPASQCRRGRWPLAKHRTRT